MARLSREDLFKIAADKGWTRGAAPTGAQRDALRAAFHEALAASDLAPTRVYDGGEMRPMTLDEAAENLLEELV